MRKQINRLGAAVAATPRAVASRAVASRAVVVVEHLESRRLLAVAPSAGTVVAHVFNDAAANGALDRRDPAVTGRHAFLDADRDGAWDRGERIGISDAAGRVRFPRVPAGRYVLRVAAQPTWRPTTRAAYVVDVTAGAATVRAFGVTRAARISGTVFFDRDRDGRRDRDEPGRPRWRVYLDTDGNGSLGAGEPSVLTSATGDYVINVRGGRYRVRLVEPDDYVATRPIGGVHRVAAFRGTVIGRVSFGGQVVFNTGSPGVESPPPVVPPAPQPPRMPDVDPGPAPEPRPPTGKPGPVKAPRVDPPPVVPPPVAPPPVVPPVVDPPVAPPPVVEPPPPVITDPVPPVLPPVRVAVYA